MELKERNLRVVDNLPSGYNTVLIDHTYNRITIYNTTGLDYERDLGKDWHDWYTEDLYTYCEMDTEELRELAQAYYFIIN